MKLALVTLSIAAATAAHAQPRQPDTTLDAAVRAQVIDASLAALRARYVFPEVAARIEAAIRAKLAAHAHDRVTSAAELARRLTADLRAVSHDKHMGLHYSAEPIPSYPPPEAETSAEDKAQLHRIAEQKNAFFVKVERLAGNIGYLLAHFTFRCTATATGPITISCAAPTTLLTQASETRSEDVQDRQTPTCTSTTSTRARRTRPASTGTWRACPPLGTPASRSTC